MAASSRAAIVIFELRGQSCSNPSRNRSPYGSHTLTLETGEIARQASGAVAGEPRRHRRAGHRASPRRQPKPGQDFFPLTVDYQEKTYAAGKIPGGFFKREGRPSEKETLTSRLIDRPMRPLFPDGFYNDVQIVATVMSVDPEIDPDIPAMIGASAAVVAVGHSVQRPDRRRARRLRRRPVRAQSDARPSSRHRSSISSSPAPKPRC